ncbi:DUF6252 family protein [Chryseobacterium sp. T1]
MKRKLLLFALSVCLLSCKDRDADPNVLPEVTQSGKNTAGALVDGKVWVATTERLPTNQDGTFCEKFGNFYDIRLDFRKVANSLKNRIYIKAQIENFELNKVYYLNENIDTSDYNYTYYSDNNGNTYMTQPNSIYKGTLKITRLDFTNQIISGSFEFKAINKDGNVISITDGRFDKKFD